jgi:3D (Asp-Asp-Asp) domain-containing protein
MFYIKKNIKKIVVSIIVIMLVGLCICFRIQYLNEHVRAERQTMLIDAITDSLSEKNDELDRLIEETERMNVRIEKLEKEKREHPLVTSRYGVDRAKAQYDDFEITYYNDQGGDGRGITATGLHTQTDYTVAVDPDVIPLGSRLVILLPDGTEYDCIAADTGGAIKGHIIDVYENSSDEALYAKGRVKGVKVSVI